MCDCVEWIVSVRCVVTPCTILLRRATHMPSRFVTHAITQCHILSVTHAHSQNDPPQEVEQKDCLTRLQQQLQDAHDRAAAAAARATAQHEQQLAELQERLQAAVSRAAVQHADDVEVSAQLRGRLQDSESQLGVLRAERDALQVCLGGVLGGCELTICELVICLDRGWK